MSIELARDRDRDRDWIVLVTPTFFWNSFVGYLLVILSMVREIFTWNSINSPEWDGLCQASRITMIPRRSAAGQWTVSQFLSRLWFQVSIWQMMFFNCDGWGNLKLFVFFFLVLATFFYILIMTAINQMFFLTLFLFCMMLFICNCVSSTNNIFLPLSFNFVSFVNKIYNFSYSFCFFFFKRK